MSKIFIDTNIFVYASDQNNPQKQMVAQDLLCNINNGVISTQVLQEFYAVATRKLSITPVKARQIIKTFEKFEITPITLTLVHEAINLNILDQIQFWDALIIAAASAANCFEVLTEDLNEGQIIAGVRVVNPFMRH
jgi:predicted nucleic acid-binding protein